MNTMELHKQIHTLAKRANQRLRELEKNHLDEVSPAYGAIERFKFDNREFMRTTAKGEMAFKTAVTGRTEKELKKELKELQQFLNAQTSTKTGIEELHKKNYEKFMQKHWKGDKKPSYKEWVRFWNNETLKKLVSLFGSEMIVKIFELEDVIDDEILTSVSEGLQTEMDRTHTQFALSDFVDALGNAVTDNSDYTAEEQRNYINDRLNF